MSKSVVIKTIIISIILVGLVGTYTYYFIQYKKTVSPISSKPQENKTIVSEKQPAKTLKEYIDSAGFSFKYPENLVVGKKEDKNTTTYANLELTSSQAKGNISIKIEDTNLRLVDEWFVENKLSTLSSQIQKIKIGEMEGSEIKDNNKLIAASINQGILFTIVIPQDQKYWQTVYNTVLSNFKFVSQQASNVSETQYLDNSNTDVVLEEETLE